VLGKKNTVIDQSEWYDFFIPSFHTYLFVFMTISMILNFSAMSLMCLAIVCFISDE